MPSKVAAVKASAKSPAAKTAKPKQVLVAVAQAKPDADEVKINAALRIKQLVERVSATGEFKKKDVRDIVEATLAELGRALEAGEVLNLPPFGKLRVGRTRDLANGSMMTLKLRRTLAKESGKKTALDGLAADGEAG